MQNFNLHTHTMRCNHAIGVDEEYVLAAIQAGLKTLGFSDHVPFPNFSYGRMEMEEAQDYIDSLRFLKEKYKDQIDIKIGFECEYFKEYTEYYKSLLQQVDYLILAQHYPALDQEQYRTICNDTLLEKYADQVTEAIQTGLFTYLAHPSYFMFAMEKWTEGCEKAMKRICECAKKHHFPLEINLKGMTNGIRDYDGEPSYPYPHQRAIALFEKYQNECAFGLDSHNPNTFELMKPLMKQFMEENKNRNLNFIPQVTLVNPVK